MKKMLASTALVAGLAIAVPAMAQGVYIGPGGVGVDSGVGYGYGHRGYDRDGYREEYRHRGYGERGEYEGRSVAPGYRHRNYFYDHY